MPARDAWKENQAKRERCVSCRERGVLLDAQGWCASCAGEFCLDNIRSAEELRDGLTDFERHVADERAAERMEGRDV